MFENWLRAQIQEFEGADHAKFMAGLSDADITLALELYKAEAWRQKHRKFELLFPDEFTKIGEGEWSEYHPRHEYPRHMEFFAAGKQYDERAFFGGNRCGKTIVGGFEVTCHLTGLYPEWWEGRRFKRAIRAIAAGKTNETTRDIVQNILLGEIVFEGARKTVDGSGLIPTELIGRSPGRLQWKQGSPDLVDMVRIKHVTGAWSKLSLKSYQQGRGAFEGTTQEVIWVDEEAPLDVYDEARIRTMTTKGITMLTFTPLEGLSDTVLAFLPETMRPPTDDALGAVDREWGSWGTEVEPEGGEE